MLCCLMFTLWSRTVKIICPMRALRTMLATTMWVLRTLPMFALFKTFSKTKCDVSPRVRETVPSCPSCTETFSITVQRLSVLLQNATSQLRLLQIRDNTPSSNPREVSGQAKCVVAVDVRNDSLLGTLRARLRLGASHQVLYAGYGNVSHGGVDTIAVGFG